MADSLVLDLLTGMPVLLKQYSFPKLVATGQIKPTPEAGAFYIIGSNNAISAYSGMSELFLVTEKGTKAMVKPRACANQEIGAAIEFLFDGDASLLTRDDGDTLACQVHTLAIASLHNRESWTTEQDLRYEQAVIASQKTAFMSEPINVIYYPLTIAQESIEAWKSVRTAQLSGDAKYSSDLSIITPEYVDEQISKWEEAQNLLTPLSDYAVRERITSPLSPGLASIEQRAHRINAVLAAWNLDHCEALEKMNSDQISKIFDDITEMLGGKRAELPTSKEEAPAADEGKPQSSTPGQSEKNTSTKSAKSSVKSLPQATDTPSSTADEQPSKS